MNKDREEDDENGTFTSIETLRNERKRFQH